MQIEFTTFCGATSRVERSDEAEGRQMVKRLMTDSSLKEILLVSKKGAQTILHLIRQDTKHDWQPLRGQLN